jgi:hypothetical protein
MNGACDRHCKTNGLHIEFWQENLMKEITWRTYTWEDNIKTDLREMGCGV